MPYSTEYKVHLKGTFIIFHFVYETLFCNTYKWLVCRSFRFYILLLLSLCTIQWHSFAHILMLHHSATNLWWFFHTWSEQWIALNVQICAWNWSFLWLLREFIRPFCDQNRLTRTFSQSIIWIFFKYFYTFCLEMIKNILILFSVLFIFAYLKLFKL